MLWFNAVACVTVLFLKQCSLTAANQAHMVRFDDGQREGSMRVGRRGSENSGSQSENGSEYPSDGVAYPSEDLGTPYDGGDYPSPDTTDRFQSYFEADYSTNFGTFDDLHEAAAALTIAYNRLIDGFENPLELKMNDVQVISATTGRRLSSEEKRELQRGGADIKTFLLSTGTCRRCQLDQEFTDDVSNRRLRGPEGRTEEIFQGERYSPYLRPGMPTEGDLLAEYSAVIRSMGFSNIVDVIALDEFDSLPTPTAGKNGNGMNGSKGSKSAKSKGSKGSKSAKSKGSKGSKSAKSKGSKGSKSAKSKGSKGSKSAKSKGSKDSKGPKGSNSGTSDGSSTDKGKKGKKGSCKDSGVGVGDPEDDGTLLSLFRVDYATLDGTGLDVEQAAQVLVVAYNELILEFEVELEMQDVMVLRVEEEDRRLRDDNGRSLQRGANTILFLQATGGCRRCPTRFTSGDDVTGRRLKGKDKPFCLRQGLPTEEEVRAIYAEILLRMQFENIEDVDDLDEISVLPTQSPTPSPTPSPTRAPISSKSRRSRF